MQTIQQMRKKKILRDKEIIRVKKIAFIQFIEFIYNKNFWKRLKFAWCLLFKKIKIVNDKKISKPEPPKGRILREGQNPKEYEKNS